MHFGRREEAAVSLLMVTANVEVGVMDEQT
jgi:hypothetical protein